MWIDIDGSLVKEEQAVISVFDHGFLYGVGCFETLRTYNKHPFLFDDHFDRLLCSLAVFGIQTEKINRDNLVYRIRKLLELNQLQDGYIRISVSAGDAPLGLPREHYTDPKTIIMCKPLSPQLLRREVVYKKLRLSPIARNTPDAQVRLKSFQYGNNIIAAQQLNLGPDEEGLFLTEEGLLSEGLVSNLFFVKNGELHTPSIDTGILNGITRTFVMKLAQRSGIRVTEGRYAVSDLSEASEVFVTNSVQELVPVAEIEAVWSQSAPSHPITLELLNNYRSYTDRFFSHNQLEKDR